MSNVKQRGNYPSEKRASLTLGELESWLTLEIAGRYHHAIHRVIHVTPLAAWTKALGRRPIPAPQHLDRFVLDFLPAVSRKIGQGGFQLFHIRYWDPLLTRLFPASQRLFVRYNPRNLAQVWVPIPGRGEYLAIHYADLRRPPISQYEQEAAMREIKSSGRRTANEDAIFSTTNFSVNSSTGPDQIPERDDYGRDDRPTRSLPWAYHPKETLTSTTLSRPSPILVKHAQVSIKDRSTITTGSSFRGPGSRNGKSALDRPLG